MITTIVTMGGWRMVLLDGNEVGTIDSHGVFQFSEKRKEDLTPDERAQILEETRNIIRAEGDSRAKV